MPTTVSRNPKAGFLPLRELLETADLIRGIAYGGDDEKHTAKTIERRVVLGLFPDQDPAVKQPGRRRYSWRDTVALAMFDHLLRSGFAHTLALAVARQAGIALTDANQVRHVSGDITIVVNAAPLFIAANNIKRQREQS